MKEIIEPLLVVSLLAGGVWVNRSKSDAGDNLYTPVAEAEQYRTVLGYRIQTRATIRYRNNGVSTLLRKYPYIVEVVYWALVYWIYQIGRAITALFLKDSTVDAAREHGIGLLDFEGFLHFAWELDVQHFILSLSPWVIQTINFIYSFVHIPFSIFFFAWLYHVESHENFSKVRRTLAFANLLAFIVFTTYPVMPPRLLPENFGFIDTVHTGQIASVWTANKFCNVLAAMPSLHFGYSAIIGCSLYAYSSFKKWNVIFLLYPVLILLCIVATANHYIIDAIAGGIICAIAFKGNRFMLNLLPIEDFILYAVHVHKPQHEDDAGLVMRTSEDGALTGEKAC